MRRPSAPATLLVLALLAIPDRRGELPRNVPWRALLDPHPVGLGARPQYGPGVRPRSVAALRTGPASNGTVTVTASTSDPAGGVG